MKKLVIALLLIVLTVGSYRLLSQKKEKGQPVEMTREEVMPTPTPTRAVLKEKGYMPSSGLSTEEKPTLPPEELQKLIKEFESEK